MRTAKKVEGRKCPICGSEENQMNYEKTVQAHKDANAIIATAPTHSIPKATRTLRRYASRP
jgi:hypothetical protein